MERAWTILQEHTSLVFFESMHVLLSCFSHPVAVVAQVLAYLDKLGSLSRMV